MTQLNEPRAALRKRSWWRPSRFTVLQLAALTAGYSLIAVPGSVESIAFESIQSVGPAAATQPSIYSYHYQHGWPFVHLYRVTLVDDQGRSHLAGQQETGSIRRFYAGLQNWELKEASGRVSRVRGMPRLPGPPWIHSTSWSTRGVASSVSYTGLVLNLMIYLATILVVALLVEYRARKGIGALQFGMREGLVLLVGIALSLGLYTQAIRKQKNSDHVVHELDLMGFDFAISNVAPAWLKKLGGDSVCDSYQRPVAVSLSHSAIGGLGDDEVERLAGKLRSLGHLDRVSIHSVGQECWDLLSQLKFRGELWLSDVGQPELIGAIASIESRSLTMVDSQPIGNAFLLQLSKSKVDELKLIGARFREGTDWRTVLDSNLTRITIISDFGDGVISTDQRLALEEAGIVVEYR